MNSFYWRKKNRGTGFDELFSPYDVPGRCAFCGNKAHRTELVEVNDLCYHKVCLEGKKEKVAQRYKRNPYGSGLVDKITGEPVIMSHAGVKLSTKEVLSNKVSELPVIPVNEVKPCSLGELEAFIKKSLKKE